MTVSASVVGRFPVPDSGLGLSIEPDLDPHSDDAIHLLLFPSDPDITVHVSVGSVTSSGNKEVTEPAGIVQFSGTATANLPHKPSGSAPEFTTLFAFDTEGNAATVSVFYDGDANVLKASQDFYGAVRYTSYTASARKLAYRPLSRPLGLGISLEFGVIAAFKPPRGPIVIYEVSPFQLANGNAVIELYKKYSLVVSTQFGTFEYPPGYPNSGAYPGSAYTGTGFSAPGVLDLSGGSMVSERPHETGFLDESGRGWPFEENVEIREPYIGVQGYVPNILNRVHALDATKYPMNVVLKALDYIKSRGIAVGVTV